MKNAYNALKLEKKEADIAISPQTSWILIIKNGWVRKVFSSQKISSNVFKKIFEK